MPFRPHSLPYKLRALFDANVLSPQDLARSVGVSTAQVDGWLRGRLPDRVTRVQVDKVLSYYTRLRNRHLKLEPEESGLDAPPAPPKRGIKEEGGAFPGTRVFNVYANNVRLGRWEALPDATDDQLLEAFEDLVERRAPVMKVVEPSPGEKQS